MEMGESPAAVAVVKKTSSLTPKAIIHQKFGTKACYKVEEVQQEVTQNGGCPGLTISHKGPCLYQCCLQLPEFSVVSEICKRKKDAEQSAAEKALQKLGVHSTTSNPTAKEAWDILAARISYLFSNEFLEALHPLSGHFRAALLREGHLKGLVPVSVIAIYDGRLNNICKCIHSDVESNPSLVTSFILRAATKVPASVSSFEEQLSMKRNDAYPTECTESLVNQNLSFPEGGIEAIRIPVSVSKTVEPIILNVSSNCYYLDVIAQELGLTDASKVHISRTIGKASSETRLYYCAPKLFPINFSSGLLHAEDALQQEGYKNVRASYFSGQDIYGDAILTSIGYTWSSTDLFYEDVSLRTYYRLLISKIPSGVYKISREAILAAELPVAFTIRNNWRGSFPREILCTFCRQHRLSEPVFNTMAVPLKSSPESSGSGRNLKVTDSCKEESNDCSNAFGSEEPVGLSGAFRCEVKILSKSQDLVVHCSPKKSYKKQGDALQNAALKVLSWLNTYFEELNCPSNNLISLGNDVGIQFYAASFSKEFALCQSVHTVWPGIGSRRSISPKSNFVNQLNDEVGGRVRHLNIEGPNSGVSPSNGSLACIFYSISLVTENISTKELLETCEEFEFEIGTGAVIPILEEVVTQMTVGQSSCFCIELPPQELILAAACDSARTLSLLSSSENCSLEYILTLLGVAEPLEERMEQALFSPPLSKQRVEFALQHIKESRATSLVDFGCGSGSLLDSLLGCSTSLETVVGVDISPKGLARAAKILHSKLSLNSDAAMSYLGIKSATLFEGSITIFDSRLYGFDIGTCLEVIEHMEEDQACLFGDVVLSCFCPRILIVSTPNYEYNVILQQQQQQKSQQDEDDPPDSQSSSSSSCKFRNHDHKFEWTREQFNRWASDLAKTHNNYTVEFSGVGCGVAEIEPGFASQIAVFRRKKRDDQFLPDNNNGEDLSSSPSHQHYQVIWDWKRSSSSN